MLKFSPSKGQTKEKVDTTSDNMTVASKNTSNSQLLEQIF